MRHLAKIIAKVLLVLLPVLLIFGAGYGCGSTADTKPKVFMWKITSDSTYVYVLGSVQVNNQLIYPLDSVIENAFSSTDDFVVGINANKVNQQEVSQYVMDYCMYPVGDGLKKNASASLYSQLEKFAQQYSIDLTTYDSFKPWVIYNVMGQLILENLGYKSELGMDSYFTNKAEKATKSVIELETILGQLNLMTAIPVEAIFAGMEYDVDNPNTAQDLKDMYNAWQTGDIVKMESIVYKALNEMPEMAPYFAAMYGARNPNFVSQIEGLLAGNKTHFIVVGAGNLMGENGVLNLLKNKGYTIEQVNASDKLK
jgi:uncharacterized protein YbaP (TraB family)